ncbi:WbqC family protein [Prolixibacter denitrificans]|uniref:WbqC-like protein n=1 Tax=Prolixibacter denitrificans TaxID=1541063 RepID=A0A2P8CBP9_9BACT|nr:WbqC family protein [Prolixibacter denitrificans]PSK82396.1 WbqC-like protein [Prolixibacter denitrificans]GET22860.1 hypothetical protein JCM18694_31060 [Prolixibacter denitrificans]
MTETHTALLSTAYLGPVQYYSKLLRYPEIIIEQHENYPKQSYRNRCRILGGNGPLTLSIPVDKGPDLKVKTKDVRIATAEDWQRLHWRTIVSAYNNSPFFPYYQDELAPFFHEKKWKYLLDFNLEIQEKVMELLEIDVQIKRSTEFIKEETEDMLDLREVIHPKKQRSKPDPHFHSEPYTQVFEEKFDFQPNLSVIDLLFNEGPESMSILEECFKE